MATQQKPISGKKLLKGILQPKQFKIGKIKKRILLDHLGIDDDLSTDSSLKVMDDLEKTLSRLHGIVVLDKNRIRTNHSKAAIHQIIHYGVPLLDTLLDLDWTTIGLLGGGNIGAKHSFGSFFQKEIHEENINFQEIMQAKNPDYFLGAPRQYDLRCDLDRIKFDLRRLINRAKETRRDLSLQKPERGKKRSFSKLACTDSLSGFFNRHQRWGDSSASKEENQKDFIRISLAIIDPQKKSRNSKHQ